MPKRGKIPIYHQFSTNLPNDHKIYQTAVIYSKWPKNIPTFSISSPSKIYPNWDFGFEKIPSGNPGLGLFCWVKSNPKQGDQIGRIFAYLVTVFFG
jgi:hypothetical protein